MKLSLQPSVNWLFAFVPITVALEHAGGLPAPLVFFAAALAIVPIASLLVHATEQKLCNSSPSTLSSPSCSTSCPAQP